MNSQQVPLLLRDVVADVLEISPEEVRPDLSSASVETWDSFRHLQLILAIESEFGVQFDPQQIPDLTTVARIEAALEQKGVRD
jgi:acyl carrier protein